MLTCIIAIFGQCSLGITIHSLLVFLTELGNTVAILDQQSLGPRTHFISYCNNPYHMANSSVFSVRFTTLTTSIQPYDMGGESETNVT